MKSTKIDNTELKDRDTGGIRREMERKKDKNKTKEAARNVIVVFERTINFFRFVCFWLLNLSRRRKMTDLVDTLCTVFE